MPSEMVEQIVEAAAAEAQAAIGAPSAKDLVAQAFRTLEDVMRNSPFPAPRVSAARAVIDLAKAEDAVQAGVNGVGQKLGKKEEAAVAAASAGQGTEWGCDLDPDESRPN